jgi:zinc protease
VQADIHIGRLAVTRTNPEYYPLMVGRMILGGGSTSRMFVDIREKEGFAYDAHPRISPADLFCCTWKRRMRWPTSSL